VTASYDQRHEETATLGEQQRCREFAESRFVDVSSNGSSFKQAMSGSIGVSAHWQGSDSRAAGFQCQGLGQGAASTIALVGPKLYLYEDVVAM